MNAALLMSAYGMPAAPLDDYLQMAEDKIIKCTKMLAETIMKVYGEQYLRAPNVKDTARLLSMNAARRCPRI